MEENEVIEEPEVNIETTDVEPESPEPVETNNEDVERARRQGWVPKEEFRGDPSRWVDAKTFNDRAENIMPILKQNNRRLEDKLASLEEQLARQNSMVSKMIEIQNKYTDTSYKTQINTIKARKLEAVKNGDEEAYRALEEEEARIERPPVVEPTQSQTDLSPDQKREMDSWFKANGEWFGKDAELTEYALFVSDKMVKEKVSLPPVEFVEEVKSRVKKIFPHKFEKPRQAVDDTQFRGTVKTTSSGKKSWNDLPEDAKKQCLKLVKEIPNFTKEKYIKEYFEEGDAA